MDERMMAINNFWGDWFTDTDMRHYPDDTRILRTNNSIDICQYLNALMKYSLEKLVKKL